MEKMEFEQLMKELTFSKWKCSARILQSTSTTYNRGTVTKMAAKEMGNKRKVQ